LIFGLTGLFSCSGNAASMALKPSAAFFSSALSDASRSSAIAAMNARVGSSPVMARSLPRVRHVQGRSPFRIAIKFDGFISINAARRLKPPATSDASLIRISNGVSVVINDYAR
jgi:hypothetical protein